MVPSSGSSENDTHRLIYHDFRLGKYFLKAKKFTQDNQLWMQEARVLNELGNYFIQNKNLHFLFSKCIFPYKLEIAK